MSRPRQILVIQRRPAGRIPTRKEVGEYSSLQQRARVATAESRRLIGERAADWGTTGTRLVDRGHLLAALDRAVRRKVTVVSAPAGSGKTSLLRAWADRPVQMHRVAFVTVRRDQRDEQLFWLALLHAIRETVDDRDADEPLIATPGFNAAAMVDRVLSHLADYPGRLVVVIDDLHELEAAGVQTRLTRPLTELPAQVHAVLGTRRDLQLRLHHLRLAGELAEIRAADLRFTEAETREVLVTAGVVLSDDPVATLQKRTEGWASYRPSGSVRSVWRTGGDRGTWLGPARAPPPSSAAHVTHFSRGGT